MDHAVGGNEIAGAQLDHIADPQRLGVHLLELYVRQPSRRRS